MLYYASPYFYGAWEFLIWDDHVNFTSNPMIQRLTLANVIEVLTTVKLNIYEPISCFIYNIYMKQTESDVIEVYLQVFKMYTCVYGEVGSLLRPFKQSHKGKPGDIYIYINDGSPRL